MPDDYEVHEGERVNSIAFDHGFFWETLWNHPSNSELNRLRGNPETLMPGDVLHIPDSELKEYPAACEQKHKFRLKGVPAKFVLVVLCRDDQNSKPDDQKSSDPWEYIETSPSPVKSKPMANAPFLLYADGVLIKNGNTDGDGRLETKLPPNARDGILILNRGKDTERTIELNFRAMDPISEVRGVCKRLNNLGFACPTDVDTVTPDVAAAVGDFQLANGLNHSGEIDDATRNKLKQLYGS